MVIQRHQLDNDVLETNSLDDIVTRIEKITQDIDKEEAVQERINDLWIRQNTLFNELRVKLELESAQDDSSVEATGFSEVVSRFTIRIASAKLKLYAIGINTPKDMAYQSQVAEILPGGGGGFESE